MGLKVAYRLILEHERLEGVLKSVYDDVKWSNKLSDYKFDEILMHYENVCKIFLHNIVFDPKKHQLIHINPISNLDNMSTNKLELLKEEVEEYKFIYDMSSFLINKNVNFINVAKGLISVADDMEIDYVLTEYDLTAIETITNKIKFDLYRLPSTPTKALNVGSSNVTTDKEVNASPTPKSSSRSPTVKSERSRSPSVKSPSRSPTPKSSSRSPSLKSEGSRSSKSSRKRSRNVSPSKLDKKTSKHYPKSHSRTGSKPTHSPTAKSSNKLQDKGTVVTHTTASGKLAADILQNHVVKVESPSKKLNTSDKVTLKTNDKLKHIKHTHADSKTKLKNENKRPLNSKGVVQNLLSGTETYTVKRTKK
ncbi:hypothetical protein MACK_004111 [Theileria orientalis]|uniref:Uncharacterized protein n=1 Tax=Theileria orientalis TaxID=68886 RepID=A0A976XJL1_THEOR|nr:hypothetical protein MACK_004111 [Theileria orientalis]